MIIEKVKWGPKWIPHTTPDFAKWIFRFVLYVAAIANFAVLVFADIPPGVKSIVGRYSIEIVAFVHGITRMFGLHIEDVPSTKDEQLK